MNRGELYCVYKGSKRDPKRGRVFCIVSRQVLIDFGNLDKQLRKSVRRGSLRNAKELSKILRAGIKNPPKEIDVAEPYDPFDCGSISLKT